MQPVRTLAASAPLSEREIVEADPPEELDDGGTRYAILALQALRSAGLRITRPRRSIVEVLERSNQPLTAAEVHENLRRKRILIDLASVYRTLAVLEERRLIHRLVTREGVVRCEPGFEGSACHHHVICRTCGEVKEIGCDVGHVLGEAARQASGFSIEAHRVELVGLCRKCQPPGESAE